MILTYDLIARKIDHALLTPTMTEAEMIAGCELARAYNVATVCIKPYAVQLASGILKGTQVGVGTVIGFPHGGQASSTKLAEARTAIAAGATEIDIVVNIGAVISGQWDMVAAEIQNLTQAAHDQQVLIKVIFENCYLNTEQKIRLCQICSEAKADYIKTSTGFGTDGATVADLELMKAHSPTTMRLKASGGIKDLETAIRFVELGSSRLGLSRTSAILDELSSRLGLPQRDVSRETKHVAYPIEDKY